MANKEFNGNLRSHIIRLPELIQNAPGISIFGRTIRSLVFTTDIAIIRNCNADAVIAVYPFTPQPIISHALINASDIPIICGVGGGTTRGKRAIAMAQYAEQQGALGVVLNAPTDNGTLQKIHKRVEVPVIITVTQETTDIQARLDHGASILNVSAAANTPALVRKIRQHFPDLAIIATGGPSHESIQQTLEAGADAITYTPPSTAELFKQMMIKYRE